MDDILYYTPFIILWVRTLLNILNIFRLKKYSLLKSRSPCQSEINKSTKLFIVTPALNEEERIEGYISQLITRLSLHPDLISRVVIVCNDSEIKDGLVKPCNYTWDVAEQTILTSYFSAISSRFDVIRYVGTAKRSGQLNFACDFLFQHHNLSQQDLVLFLDVDAVLDEDFFQCVDEHIKYSNFDLAQIPSIYLPAFKDRHYDMVAAHWQNYFMLARERTRFISREHRNSFGNAMHENFWYTANGVIIKYSLITSVGGFTEHCAVDDLATSGLFCAKGCRITLIKNFLKVYQVPGFLADFKQKLFWCSSYREMFQLIDFNELSWKLRVGYILFRLTYFLTWLLRAPIIIGLVLASFFNHELLYISLLSYIAYLISSYAFPFLFLPDRERFLPKLSFLSVLYGTVYPIVQSFVPWVMLAKQCMVYLDFSQWRKRF